MTLKYYRLSAGIWFLMMLFILFLPGSATPEVPPFIPHFDKIVHAGIFGVLVGLLGFSFSKVSKRFQLYLLVSIVLFAGMSEVIQEYLVPGRGGDWGDFIADLVGIGIGVLISYTQFCRVNYVKEI